MTGSQFYRFRHGEFTITERPDGPVGLNAELIALASNGHAFSSAVGERS